jgi:hypothetical protein
MPPERSMAVGRTRTNDRSPYRATEFQQPQRRGKFLQGTDLAGCVTGFRKCERGKRLHEPAGLEQRFVALKTHNSRPKVKKSKIELTDPSTSMKLRMNLISQWRGCASSSSSTSSIGIGTCCLARPRVMHNCFAKGAVSGLRNYVAHPSEMIVSFGVVKTRQPKGRLASALGHKRTFRSAIIMSALCFCADRSPTSFVINVCVKSYL